MALSRDRDLEPDQKRLRKALREAADLIQIVAKVRELTNIKMRRRKQVRVSIRPRRRRMTMVFRRIVGMIVVVLVGIALSTPGMAASGKKKSASTGNTSRSVRDASAALPPVYVNPMYPGYGENFNPHRP